MAILADLPELVALANLSGVAPSRMAAAFNDPENILTLLALDEIQRISGACTRLGALTTALAESLGSYTAAVRAALSEPPDDAD